MHTDCDSLFALTGRRPDFERRALGGGGVAISYAHADEDFVDLLVSRFDQDGINHWRDRDQLVVGQAIDQAISEGIQRHRLFPLVLTQNSIGSRRVQREFQEASHEHVEGRKIMLPPVPDASRALCSVRILRGRTKTFAVPS